jgi:hypothetical protein
MGDPVAYAGSLTAFESLTSTGCFRVESSLGSTVGFSFVAADWRRHRGLGKSASIEPRTIVIRINFMGSA